MKAIFRYITVLILLLLAVVCTSCNKDRHNQTQSEIISPDNPDDTNPDTDTGDSTCMNGGFFTCK